MSDTAESEASRAGGVKGTSGPGGESPSEGTLKAEDAERFASAFVPVWQFDEAPFSAGAKFSAGELEELGASSGVNSDRTIVDPKSPAEIPPSFHDEPTSADVDVSAFHAQRPLDGTTAPIAGAPQTHPSSDAKTVAVPVVHTQHPGGTAASPQIAPTPVRSPAASPARTVRMDPAMAPGSAPGKTRAPRPHAVAVRPAPKSYSDADFVPRKSNNTVLFAVAGAAAAIVVVVGIAFTRGDGNAGSTDKAATSTTASSHSPPPRTTEEPPIPPPPPIAEAPPIPETNVSALPPAAAPPKAAPPLAPPSPPPVAVAPLSPKAPAVVPLASHSPDATHVQRNATAPSKNSTKPSSGGIVRDNPF